MSEQHSAIVNEATVKHQLHPAKKQEKHPYAIVTIAMGEGVSNLIT